MPQFQFVIRSSTRWTESLRDDLIEEQERIRNPVTRPKQVRSMKRIDLCKNLLGNAGVIILSEALRDPVGLQGKTTADPISLFDRRSYRFTIQSYWQRRSRRPLPVNS